MESRGLKEPPGTSKVYLDGVTYGNGLFVTVGEAGLINTSTDGIYWTERHTGTYSILFGVTYGNGLFVTVGNSTILTSSDGISWTQRYSGTSHFFLKVTYGNGLFVTVGNSGTIHTSPMESTGLKETLEHQIFSMGLPTPNNLPPL